VKKLGHHTSHRALLSSVVPAAPLTASVDAIIVPTARPSAKLRNAAHLARRQDSDLIVLASKRARRKAILTLRRELRVKKLHVVDVPPVVSSLPLFETSRLLRKKGLSRATDVSTKRNVGLAVARMAGLNTVLFLDDDVIVDKSRHVRVAAGLLSFNHAVGLHFEGMPDNSVVCHARREVGYRQDAFVGAGALVVATDKVNSFFPDVYNEDWFFLLDGERIGSVARTGSARQCQYDPFDNEDRARAQEFGDLLAEGIFSLLDNGGSVDEADRGYWFDFIHDRQRMIEDISEAVIDKIRNGSKRDRILRSLTAARETLVKYVTPDLCTEFIEAWRNDLKTWRSFLATLPTGQSVSQALVHLHLHEQWEWSLSSLVPVREVAGHGWRMMLSNVLWARHHVQMERAWLAQLHKLKVIVVLFLVLLMQLRAPGRGDRGVLLRILLLSLQQQFRLGAASTQPRSPQPEIQS